MLTTAKVDTQVTSTQWLQMHTPFRSQKVTFRSAHHTHKSLNKQDCYTKNRDTMGEQHQQPTPQISEYHTRATVRFTQSNLRDESCCAPRRVVQHGPVHWAEKGDGAIPR